MSKKSPRVDRGDKLKENFEKTNNSLIEILKEGFAAVFQTDIACCGVFDPEANET